jgi:hypothetical protein
MSLKTKSEVNTNKKVSDKVIVRKCHVCGSVTESTTEVERCIKCNKAFLPLNYFSKVHNHSGEKYSELFSTSEELTEEELIIGIFVLW